MEISDPLNFEPIKSDSPLAATVNRSLNSGSVKRLKHFANFFSDYHLKNVIIEEVDGRTLTIAGRKYANFSSANYLGLEQNTKVLAASKAGHDRWGMHSGCSRIFASHKNIIDLEGQLASLVGAKKTLLCANTSHTHAGVIEALFSNRNCTLYIDKFAHTSLLQAAKIAVANGAQIIKVDIRDTADLERRFIDNNRKQNVLLVDGIYSMSGEVPDFKNLQILCKDSNVILYVDDAHGIGILGENGGGVAEAFNLDFDNLILTGTLQKGLGCFGGFVAGHEGLIDLLRVTSKSYIFSGAVPPPVIDAGLKAVEICKSDEGKVLRQNLLHNCTTISESLANMGFTVSQSGTPIIAVDTGSDLKTMLSGKILFENGIYLNSVMFPAVPKGQGILRISVTATHSTEEISKLLKGFETLKAKYSAQDSRLGFYYKSLKAVAFKQL